MMPLTLANVGEENMIKKVGGNPEEKTPGESGIRSGRKRHRHHRHGGEYYRQRKGSPCGYQQGNGAENHGLICHGKFI